ncbi:MAG TPA: type II toxin-antitoxin system Phd/YefM family antitoxin [Spirochaetota bacterium]|nr:type II toxin-antitoxin system Phd/YefM family antitoxin [Spirochaetota bacterium]
MEFITVRDFRTKPAQIWKDLALKQELVITNNGKPIALLTPLSDANLEDTIKSIRKVRAINSVKTMQQISILNQNINICDDEINLIISETRQNKK